MALRVVFEFSLSLQSSLNVSLWNNQYSNIAISLQPPKCKEFKYAHHSCRIDRCVARPPHRRKGPERWVFLSIVKESGTRPKLTRAHRRFKLASDVDEIRAGKSRAPRTRARSLDSPRLRLRAGQINRRRRRVHFRARRLRED